MRKSRRLTRRILGKLLFCQFLPGCLALGPAGLQAGTDEWVGIGPSGGSILAIAIDPQHPATLYAGTFGGGVFKSTNGGGSWTASNNGLPSSGVSTIAIDPQSPATLYAGTSGGVFKSTRRDY